MGWNASHARPLCSLAAPLDGVGVGAAAAAAVAALRASGAGFDLMSDWGHAAGVLDLVRAARDPPPPPGTAEVYELALVDPAGRSGGAGAAVAPAASTAAGGGGGGGGDGSVVGAAAVFLSGSRLADHVPALRAAAGRAAWRRPSSPRGSRAARPWRAGSCCWACAT